MGLRFLVRFSDHDESTLMCSVCMTLRSAHHYGGGCFLFRSKSEVDPNGFVWFDSELKDIPTERDCRGPGRVSQPSWSHWAQSLRRPRPLAMFGCRARRVLRTRGGELETNPEIKQIQNQLEVELNESESSRTRVMSPASRCNMETWTYGLGKGWLVGMKPTAQAAARQPYRQGRLDGWCPEVDCSGTPSRIPRR